MRNLNIAAVAALALIAFSISSGSQQAAIACSNDPCVYQEAPPKIVIKTVYVYVQPGEEAPPAVVKKLPPRKKIVSKKSPPVVDSECVFMPFPNGYAKQPVLFFQNKADAHCQKRKIFCTKCTDWIHGLRGPVFGPAARMKGGNSKAFAPPAGEGAWVPRDNKGLIAYCDQAVGNDTYSWLLKE